LNRSLNDRVIALAGIFQAARLVQQFARQGKADQDAFAASIESILKIDAANTEEVYGGAAGVSLGLQELHDKLQGGNEPGDLEMARYVIAMIQLEGVLEKRQEIPETIRRGIETAQAQMKFFEAEDDQEGIHPKLIEKLAELYIQTISTLAPRIMVNGEPGYLANPRITGGVRAALLAGIRSAVLWRQLGGRRWQLLLSRKKIAAEAGKILDAIKA